LWPIFLGIALEICVSCVTCDASHRTVRKGFWLEFKA